MIRLEPWERAKLEDEVRYYSEFFFASREPLPVEHVLEIRRAPRVSLTFLLVQSPYGLAYESYERVVFEKSTAERPLVQFAPEIDRPEVWRIVL